MDSRNWRAGAQGTARREYLLHLVWQLAWPGMEPPPIRQLQNRIAPCICPGWQARDHLG